MPFEIIGDWPLGTIFGVVLIVLYACVLFLIGWGIFWAIDSWWRPLKSGIGIVRDKTFTPAHTQIVLIYNAATKTSLPHPVYFPDNWSLDVEVNGDIGSIDISKKFYDYISLGKHVAVEYVTGRLSNDLYIRKISTV